MNAEKQLREQLVDAYVQRALADLQTWRVLRDELGAVRAEELMKRAQFAYGHTQAARFKKFAPADLKGLCDAFLAALPDEGRAFEPDIVQSDGQRLEIRLRRSPYVRAWREAGVSDAELAALTRIAAASWAGMFKGAGFRFVGRAPGGGGDAHVLHIERAPGSHHERGLEHPITA